MRRFEDRTRGVDDGDELRAEAWFALGTSTLGARLLGAARVAAMLHEDGARGLEAGLREGVTVEERLLLLDGVGGGGGAAGPREGAA